MHQSVYIPRRIPDRHNIERSVRRRTMQIKDTLGQRSADGDGMGMLTVYREMMARNVDYSFSQ